MKYNITKKNLHEAKKKIVEEYLDDLKNDAKKQTEEIFKQFNEKDFSIKGQLVKEEPNAKRNR